MDTNGRVIYTVPVAVALRGIGVGAVALGGCIVVAVLVAAVDLSRALTVAVWILLGLAATIALVVLAAGLLRLAGRGVRLVLDDEGFVNATGPGAGVRRAAWKDVRKVQTDGQFVAIDLAGGRRSLIRTSIIDAEPKELARQFRERLNRGRGYRPRS